MICVYIVWVLVMRNRILYSVPLFNTQLKNKMKKLIVFLLSFLVFLLTLGVLYSMIKGEWEEIQSVTRVGILLLLCSLYSLKEILIIQ